jgi:adenylate kinase
MYVMILGAPGSGKGTQGKILAGHLGIPQVSTGDLLRAAVKAGTPLGKQAQGYMDKGLLVPDEVIIGLIREILDSDTGRGGVLMDGFPRTVAQAEAVDRILGEKGDRVGHVALLEVDEQELVQRLLARAAKEGRSDDNLESIERRLRVFHEQTEPLLAYYEAQDVVRRVAGMGDIDAIQQRLRVAVAG